MSANMDELEKKWEEELKKRQQEKNPPAEQAQENPQWQPVSDNIGAPQENAEHMEEPPTRFSWPS